MNNDRDKIIQLVKFKGPVVPSQISKEIGTNILFASAILSELVDSKKLKISNVKVGSSPVYYAEGQEYKLQNYSKHLHEKEQKAFALLQKQKILRDHGQEPVIRAALREIKDFAVPLDVNHGGKVEVFWKWYLVSDSEATALIKKELGIEEPKPEIKQELPIAPPSYVQQIQQPIAPQPVLQEKSLVQKQEQQMPKPQTLESKGEKPFVDSGEPNDLFYKKLRKFCEENEIVILGVKVVRKAAEIDMLLQIPSAVGTLTYFCKAKNKKKCSEGDLSAAYVQGQAKRLPILFITTGELTKRAKDMLSHEFKNMHVKGI